MRVLMAMPAYNMFKPDKRSYFLSHGIMYVASWLKSRGFNVDTLNLNHYPPQALGQALAGASYDAVLTGGLFTHFDSIKFVLDETKKAAPRAKTILGGAIATAHPELALKALNPDYLILGEGELAAESLLTVIDQGRDPVEAPSAAFMKNGACVQTEKGPNFPNLDDLPYPDYQGFEFGRYLDHFPHNVHGYFHVNDNTRFGFVLGGRDCPAKCTFCFRALGGKVRFRTVPSLVKEMEFLQSQYGVDGFLIMDDLFALTRKRVDEFCDAVMDKNIKWFPQMRVTIATEDLLKKMKDSGCFMVSYGIESGSQTILDSMRKGTTVSAIEKALRLTRQAGIGFQGNILFGDPAETWQTFEESADFYRRHLNFAISAGHVRPYPGTDLYKNLLPTGRMGDLVQFWRNNACLPDGSFPNMTALPDDEYKKLYRYFHQVMAQKSYAEIIEAKALVDRPDEFYIKIACPVCGKRSGGLAKLWVDAWAVCPHCGQRSWLPASKKR